MSKISDALRKAAGGNVDPAERSAEEPRRSESSERPEPARVEPSHPAPRPYVVSQGAQPGTLLDDEFARELSGLRASIEQALPDVPQRTLLVVGSIPGEGSSTVAARFAQLLGEDHRMRVAMVDADFRNEDPRSIPAVEPGTGLAGVLSGQVSPAHALRPTTFAGLDVLPSEGLAPDPYVLCTADHMTPFLDYLRGQYHYAILDAAPVLSAPETSVIASMVDGVVIVVRAGRTKREVVQRSIEKLRSRGARVLGVVMNRQQYVIPEFIYRRL